MIQTQSKIKSKQRARNSNNPYYIILSLDGGGVRGVLQTAMLQNLETMSGLDNILSCFQMFAGTSAGAINASAFAYGYTVAETQTMAQKDASKIFAEKLYLLTQPFYSNDGLVSSLTTALGNKTFGELENTLCVNTYCVTPPSIGSTWSAVTINNLGVGGDFTNATLVDSVAASASAPLYFPIYNTSNIFVGQPQASFVDGGVFANNPTVTAIQTAMGAGIQLEDIVVLSIGTGYVDEYIKDVGNGKWGLSQWFNFPSFKPMYLPDLLQGNQLYDIQDSANLILGVNYQRVNFLLPNPIPLDDVAAIPQLISIGNSFDVTPIWNWLSPYLLPIKMQNKKQKKQTNKKGCNIC